MRQDDGNFKDKIRSDKFPITLHPTGQYCKKIKGKIRHFGTDKKKALEKYSAQATYLHGALSLGQKISNGKMTLKQICDLYLHYQNSRILVGDITAKHYNDLKYSLSRFMVFLGQGCKIESISSLDLQDYKRKLQSSYPSIDRRTEHPWRQVRWSPEFVQSSRKHSLARYTFRRKDNHWRLSRSGRHPLSKPPRRHRWCARQCFRNPPRC